MISAIETKYKGYRFRSRLEARWAVFFDALGLQWEYEAEGYKLPSGDWYLPDFRMQGTTDTWFVECKPDWQLSQDEIRKCAELSDEAPIALLVGTPQPPVLVNGKHRGSWAMSFGKYISGPKAEHHPMDQRLYCWHERAEDGSFLLWPVPAFEPAAENEIGYEVFVPGRNGKPDGCIRVRDPLLAKTKFIDSPKLLSAYDAARGARFEHGEKP